MSNPIQPKVTSSWFHAASAVHHSYQSATSFLAWLEASQETRFSPSSRPFLIRTIMPRVGSESTVPLPQNQGFAYRSGGRTTPR